jgi:NAD(P)H-flavin reductase
MLSAFGIGEVPISFSGAPEDPVLVHTIRDVGAVTRALCALDVGDVVGVRGPYGSAWPIEDARGGDLLVVAGGIGLAPLRPAIRAALADRDAFDRVAVLCGARTPDDLLYPAERLDWSERPDVQVLTTVDAAGEDWTGAVGVVPSLVARAEFDPARTTALICGPEVMLRFTVRALEDAGLAADRVHVSLERNMACAVGLCGRCQLGPEFVCMDGPVFVYPRVADLLAVAEL